MFLISSLTVLAIVVLAFWLGGPVAMYINVPSVVIVTIPALLALKLKLGDQSSITMLKTLLDNNQEVTHELKSLYKASLKTMSEVAIAMGWLGVLIGLVAIGLNVEPSQFKEVIGPAMAVCILTILYAYIIKVLCILAETQLSKSISKPESIEEPHQLELI